MERILLPFEVCDLPFYAAGMILIGTHPNQALLYKSLLLPKLVTVPAVVTSLADRGRRYFRRVGRTGRENQWQKDAR
jgi:hypothetical protein